MLDDAPWNPFVHHLIELLPLDDVKRREVVARFALACSKHALRVCDRAGIRYPAGFDVCVLRVTEWLADPSPARRDAAWDLVRTNRSGHAATMVEAAVTTAGLGFATHYAALTAVEAAATIAGGARDIGDEPAPVRPQQVAFLGAAISDALRAGWTPPDDAAPAWARVDELLRRTWPQWLAELGRSEDAGALEACAAIVDAGTFRAALAVADARWPALDAYHEARQGPLRATSKRLAAQVQYEDGNFELVDYAEDDAAVHAGSVYEAAAATLATGESLDDAVGVLIDATRLAACVHATIAAVVADRAVAISAKSGDVTTAEAVQEALRELW